MGAYKLVWTLGPLFFGLAFAYLLTVLWGQAPAGIALWLLAFKVFPDTGLHHVVPSNLAMAIAVMVWARVISRKGKAIWSLIIGTLLLITMHPVGRIYAVMAVALALSLVGFQEIRRAWLPAISVLLVLLACIVFLNAVGGLGFVRLHILPRGDAPLMKMFYGAGVSVYAFLGDILRLQGGLFGSFPLFCGALALGLLTGESGQRTAAVKTLAIYGLFLVAALFYVSNHPADLLFRMWIPFLVILFGAVGQAFWYTARRTWRLLVAQRTGGEGTARGILEKWPVVVLAVLLGYALHMMITGGEQIIATGAHTENRQPLAFYPGQVDRLLSRARPGDRVLYTSMIIMPYYFIHGAMDLGAIYYHPSMGGTRTANEWLGRSDIRFAVVYNPTVYHPSFEGTSENKWWVTSPLFYFSPLFRERKYGPIAREGLIHASHFKWIELKVGTGVAPGSLRAFIRNPGRRSSLDLVPLDRYGRPVSKLRVRKAIEARFEGWVKINLARMASYSRFRILLPTDDPSFALGGLVFGKTSLRWPWAQKADLTFLPRDGGQDPITVSFDAAKILPSPFNKMQIRVLDDHGSSVLFQMGQERLSPGFH
jgi:hypothetical protein